MKKYKSQLFNSSSLFRTSKKWWGGLLTVSAIVVMSSSVNNPEMNPDPSPEKQLASFEIADGFEVSLFAAEPFVVKPIQMNWDADGRLWVVSSTAYPHLKTGEQANDKVFILEDTDGDGKADKSTIFAEGLLQPTGILPGDGGVYVANSTEILHLADTDGDGKADKRTKVLSGFGTADTHHLIHTFRWGPDGRFYFNQSIYIYSHVETPKGVKRLEGGGVWQLRPETLDLNVYAKGLVNPWGIIFNKWGQSFLTDGAGGDGINYGFPGVTFITSPGAERVIRGLNPGQPKHSGLDVVSGRHLPDSWQGNMITNDFRANRINRFQLQEQGSGYVSKQQDDILWTKDVAFRPVDISVGPDGAIYVADWYNPIIQHGEVDFHDPRRDQARGRIWKIKAKNKPLLAVPKLSTYSIEQLLDALKVPEDWTRNQSRQVLKEKGAKAVIPALEKWVAGLSTSDANYEHHLLEALWVYQGLDVVNEELLQKVATAKSHNARAAGLRGLTLWGKRVKNLNSILEKAVQDEHPQVRLEAVIALSKAETAEAARTALSVLDKPMDEYLDYALWQTMRELEPKWLARVKADPNFMGDAQRTTYALKSVSKPDAIAPLLSLYQKGQVPAQYQNDVLGSIAKFGTSSDLNSLFDLALNNKDKSIVNQLGALENAARQRNVIPTKDINRITSLINQEDPTIASNAVRLVGLWKMENQAEQLLKLLEKPDAGLKKSVLEALASINTNKTKQLLVGLTEAKNKPELRIQAVSQLSKVDPAQAAKIAVGILQSVPAETDASEIFQAFISNRSATKSLANEFAGKKIPETLAKASRIAMQRQIPWNRQSDPDILAIASALEASGGTLPVEKMPQDLNDEQIAQIASNIGIVASKPAEGEKIYRRAELACITCHSIGGAGGRIGPDLSSLGTSSPTSTIIRSLLYPTHSIKEGYELQRLVKKDGSELMGYLVSTSNSEIIMRDVTGQEIAVPKGQVDNIEQIPGSLMPAGLTAGLERQEFLNLVAFLSKLGESGEFRVPSKQYIRRWRMAAADSDLTKRLKAEGTDYVVKANAKVDFTPIYSMVSGKLPVDELPLVDGAGGKKYSILRFELEALSKGTLQLGINDSKGITAWLGNKAAKIDGQNISGDIQQGRQPITLVIDRTAYKNDELRLEVLETSSAQIRMVMGQ